MNDKKRKEMTTTLKQINDHFLYDCKPPSVRQINSMNQFMKLLPPKMSVPFAIYNAKENKKNPCDTRWDSVEGFDYSELFSYFNLELERPEDELISEVRKKVSELASSVAGGEIPCEEDSHDIKTLRLFVKRLATNYDTSALPLIEGLYMIEDDQTFLQYLNVLLPNLWT